MLLGQFHRQLDLRGLLIFLIQRTPTVQMFRTGVVENVCQCIMRVRVTEWVAERACVSVCVCGGGGGASVVTVPCVCVCVCVCVCGTVCVCV